MPVAEATGVKFALHPDDPPFDIVIAGVRIPRIITGQAAYDELFRRHASPANGICLCTGSLGPDSANDLSGMVRRYGQLGRLPFVHLRNICRIGPRSFYESRHNAGDVPMRAVVQALHDVGFDGVFRPDHGHRIEGCQPAPPGYAWETRAMGRYYVLGLWEGIGGR